MHAPLTDTGILTLFSKNYPLRVYLGISCTEFIPLPSGLADIGIIYSIIF